jgi:hypothetical protein
MHRRLIAFALLSFAALSGPLAGGALADTPPAGCSIHHQVGPTKHLSAKGMTVGSVKQYYGFCNGNPRNWAYLWIWDQAKAAFGVQGHVWIGQTGGPTVGRRDGARGVQEVVGPPVNTVNNCTFAAGGVVLFSRVTGQEVGSALDFTSTAC